MRILRLIGAASLISAALVADGARAQTGPEGMTKPGTHLILSLDVAEVRTYWLSSMRDDVRSRLREAKVGFAGLAVVDNMVTVRLARTEDADAALKVLADLAPAAPNGTIERILGSIRGSSGRDVVAAKDEAGNITITPTEEGLERRTNAALDNAVAIVGRRLDGMAIAANAERRGLHQIYVHAPALGDAHAAKKLLTKRAALGFHEVHVAISVEQARQERVPAGFKIYPAPAGGELLLRETPVVRGNDLVDAQATLDARTSGPIITFRFNNAGTRAFAKFTAENVARPFAIVLDDVVLSAPVIREPILGGTGQVSGNFTTEEVKQLAVQLRAGALPARLVVLDERVVPSGR